MLFRTIVSPYHAAFLLDHSDKTLWLGSCFTEAIGGRLVQYKFPALINPFGNIFNPLSLAFHLQQSLFPRELQDNELVYNNELWYSWHHHGTHSATEKKKVIKNTFETWQQCGFWLKETKALYITLGSAWVYEYIENSLPVANCHKVPNTKFSKRLLNIEEITVAFETVLEQWKNVNPGLQVVLTVSPVKHLRDGIAENNRSKATLILAAYALAEKLDYINYFPAYELVADDLRDYRFYKEDLAHPNLLAEQYVWEYFCNTYFNLQTMTLVDETESLISGLHHKPFHPQSQSHQAFLNGLLAKTKYLSNFGINVSEENEQIKNQIR